MLRHSAFVGAVGSANCCRPVVPGCFDRCNCWPPLLIMNWPKQKALMIVIWDDLMVCNPKFERSFLESLNWDKETVFSMDRLCVGIDHTICIGWTNTVLHIHR
jgi:hypothetical protein